jgi:hypothetical protein
LTTAFPKAAALILDRERAIGWPAWLGLKPTHWSAE